MAIHIGRRKFTALLGGAAAAWPLVGRAQQPAMPVIGLLTSRAASDSPQLLAALRQGLKESGFVEGQNLNVIPGGFEATDDRLAERAAALVNAAPDAIVAGPMLIARQSG